MGNYTSLFRSNVSLPIYFSRLNSYDRKMSFTILDLPPEILEIIFLKLNLNDIVSCSNTCIRWRTFIVSMCKDKGTHGHRIYTYSCVPNKSPMRFFVEKLHTKCQGHKKNCPHFIRRSSHTAGNYGTIGKDTCSGCVHVLLKRGRFYLDPAPCKQQNCKGELCSLIFPP